MRVAVLGTGTMGEGMARSLLRAGHEVTVWNRTRSRAEPLAADGATVADTPAGAVAGAEMVLTILFDTDAVLTVLGEAAGSVAPQAIWVQSSTIGLDGTARAARLAAERGIGYLDAPVVGTKGPAAQGKLVVLVSGEPALRERAQPVFDAIGARTVVAGDTPGPASALKLVVNAWIASVNAANAQSLALAGALGLDPRLFLDTIRGGPTDNAYAQAKGAAILAGDFDPQFTVAGVTKDLGLIRAAAGAAGVPTVLLDGLVAAYRSAEERGHSGSDMAAVAHAFQPD